MPLSLRGRIGFAASSLVPDLDVLNYLFALPTFVAQHRRFPVYPAKDRADVNDLIFHRMLRNRSYANQTIVDKRFGKYIARGMVPSLFIAKTFATIPMRGMSFDEFCKRLSPFFNRPLVAKPAHSSGGVLFLSGTPSRAEMRDTYDIAIKDYFFFSREIVYKGLSRNVIIEESLAVDGVAPDDFKFFCANGVVLFCQVDRNRFTHHTRDLYECSTWARLPISYRYPLSEKAMERPRHLDEMAHVASTLSRGFEFLRVDLYVVDDHVYFGEMTFHPEAARGRFSDGDFCREILKRIREASRGVGKLGLW